MRRLDRLITAARLESENSGVVSSTAGITDEEFVQWANDAQDHLQNKIDVETYGPFAEETFIDVVANQEAYSMPARALLGDNISKLWYSDTGQTSDYYPLNRVGQEERNSSRFAYLPTKYIVRKNRILINPVPQKSITNGIRLDYAKALDRVDKRRAIVDAVTLDTVNRTITALSLDVSSTDPIFIAADVTVDDFISIVDRNGVIKMQNIPISAVNETTGDVTVISGFVYESGETIAVGDYVVSGQYATTHSRLPDSCEMYLIQYMVYRALMRDSASDSQARYDTILAPMIESLLSGFAELTNDVEHIPVLSNRFTRAFW